MSENRQDELLSAIRQLPLEDRLQLIERAGQEAAEDTPVPAEARQVSPRVLIGLMADEPKTERWPSERPRTLKLWAGTRLPR